MAMDQQPMSSMNLDSEVKTIPCIQCGKTFDVEVVKAFPNIHTRFCPPCGEAYEREYEERQQALKRRAREIKFMELCPKDMLEVDRSLLPCLPERFDKVVNWQYGVKGLMIHGESRRGKTRAIWQLAKKLIVDEGRRIKIMRSNDLGNEIEKSFISPWGHNQFLTECKGVDVFILDDIMKGKWTERVEADMFDIIDHRTSNQKPIIITSQYVGDTLQRMFLKPETAVATIERIREYCEAVCFAKTAKQEEMGI
jgi:DNA replication protein DnaC